jgi:enoyl-[acyl-carrier-protein] reductase (NADH)
LQPDAAALEELLGHRDQLRMLRRSPQLAEVAATAVFLASEQASAITGSFVNVSSGIFASQRRRRPRPRTGSRR